MSVPKILWSVMLCNYHFLTFNIHDFQGFILHVYDLYTYILHTQFVIYIYSDNLSSPFKLEDKASTCREKISSLRLGASIQFTLPFCVNGCFSKMSFGLNCVTSALHLEVKSLFSPAVRDGEIIYLFLL